MHLLVCCPKRERRLDSKLFSVVTDWYTELMFEHYPFCSVVRVPNCLLVDGPAYTELCLVSLVGRQNLRLNLHGL